MQGCRIWDESHESGKGSKLCAECIYPHAVFLPGGCRFSGYRTVYEQRNGSKGFRREHGCSFGEIAKLHSKMAYKSE